MDTLGFGFSLVCALVAACWAYGSADPEKRARFKTWASSKLSAFAPRAKRLIAKSACLGVTIWSAWVVKESWSWVSDFLASTAPLQRKEVFALCVRLFNFLAYTSSFCAFLALTLKRAKKADTARSVPLLRLGDRIELRLAEGATIEALAENLSRNQIGFLITEINAASVGIAINTPNSLQWELVKAEESSQAGTQDPRH